MCDYDAKVQALAKALRPMVAFSNAEEATIVAYGWWKPDIGKTPEQIDSSRAVLDERVSEILASTTPDDGYIGTCLRAIEAQPKNEDCVRRSALREALMICATDYLAVVSSSSLVSA